MNIQKIIILYFILPFRPLHSFENLTLNILSQFDPNIFVFYNLPSAAVTMARGEWDDGPIPCK